MKNILSIAIHGGAGTLLKGQMTPEKEMAYRNALKSALNKGYEILGKGRHFRRCCRKGCKYSGKFSFI